jgi:hypothetical protein
MTIIKIVILITIIRLGIRIINMIIIEPYPYIHPYSRTKT